MEAQNLNFILYLELYFISYLILILILALYYKCYYYNIRSFRKIIYIGILGLLIYLHLLSNCLSFDNFYFYGKAFYFSSFSVIIKMILIVLVICIFISMLDYYENEKYLILEIPFIMLMSIEGMFLLLISNDLFLIYLALELQSLSLYILAATKRYSNLSIEAGFKYFIYGSFASGLMLFGISFIYGFVGSTNLLVIYTFLSVGYDSNIMPILGHIFILGGILFKLGLVPFHNWVADVYEGSPLIITYFFSIIPKIVIFIIFFRVYKFIYCQMYLILHLIDPIYSIVFCVSIISIIIGSVGALYQYTIKRLLAYSAIANMGFVILNLHTLNGFSSSLYFLIIYIFVSINIFTILLNIKRNDHEIKNIVEFISVAFSNYYLSILLVFALFSLAGIPPFIGFFGKLYVFINLIEYGFYYTGFIIMLLSILICVYYIRLIRFIWFVEHNSFPIFKLNNISSRQAYNISFFSILNIFAFFFQGPLLIWINNISIEMIIYA